MKKICLLLIGLLFLIPLYVNAEHLEPYYWDEEDSLQMRYLIDLDYWSEDDSLRNNEGFSAYDSIFKSECGYLFTYTYDYYDQVSQRYTRKQMDYHIFNDSSNINSMIKYFEKGGADVFDYEIKSYEEFQYLLLKSTVNNEITYTYATVNNGNVLVFYYMGNMSNECLVKVDEIKYFRYHISYLHIYTIYIRCIFRIQKI
jgi:hypothetical protein